MMDDMRKPEIKRIPPNKILDSEKINSDVEAFLANGNSIQKFEQGATGTRYGVQESFIASAKKGLEKARKQNG